VRSRGRGRERERRKGEKEEGATFLNENERVWSKTKNAHHHGPLFSLSVSLFLE
jgi:hypothetical protein